MVGSTVAQVISGTLPAKTGFIGEKGDGSTSLLQGVPAEAGTFPLVLTTDAAVVSVELKLTLTVAPKLQIATVGVARAQVGKRYRLALASRGGVGDTRWALAAGPLPSGLTLNTATGVISGKARSAGRFRFTLVVTDALGGKSAMTYSLIVRRR